MNCLTNAVQLTEQHTKLTLSDGYFVLEHSIQRLQNVIAVRVIRGGTGNSRIALARRKYRCLKWR